MSSGAVGVALVPTHDPDWSEAHCGVAADGGLVVCGWINHQAVVAPVVNQVPGHLISGPSRSRTSVCYVPAMDIVRHVVVFDAADLDAESKFWAGMFRGHVFGDDMFHCIIDSSGEWRVGVQSAPDHVPPQWPDGAPQQVHLDLHVQDPRDAHEVALGLGARLLQDGDMDADEGHQVYADPAGHPFCIGWGHPSRAAVAPFVADRLVVDDSTG